MTDAEIKVPSVENSKLTNVFSFKAWSRSKYSVACFDHYHNYFPNPNFYLPSPFTFIQILYFLTAISWAKAVVYFSHGIKQAILLVVTMN